METINFKTNINCSGCIAKVTPELNAAVGEGNWKVDTADPAKVLSVTGETDSRKIIATIEKVGFKAQRI
ncbi:MAG: cation transporter [Chryseolinea sp.]